MLRVFETFSGIGAQHKALERQRIDSEVVATSEWDIDAIICYDAIHHGNVGFKELESVFLSELNKYMLDQEYKEKFEKRLNYDFNIKKDVINDKFIKTFLYDYVKKVNTFSRDGKTPINTLNGISDNKLKRLFIANRRNKNVGSIVDVRAKDIPAIDLLTYSFPCQDLSVASMGRGKGMKKDSESRSALLWQIGRIIEELYNDEEKQLPKYLLLENVTAMINKTHKEDYEKWLDHLAEYGYKTHTFKLNASDFGVPQPRKRVFAISVLEDNLKIEKEEEIKVVSKEVKLRDILNEGKKYKDELDDATPNDTPSRRRMRKENYDLSNSKYTRTLTTKQDRHPNAGMLEHINVMEGKANFRFLTPRECFMLMGFDSDDFSRVKEEMKCGFTRKEKLYQQAGNSIVVNVLESIFKIIEENEYGK